MSQIILAIVPLPCHLTVSTQLHGWSIFTRVDGFILLIDFFSFPFFFSVYSREFHTVKCDCNEYCLVFERIIFFLLIQSSLPAQSVAIFSQTSPRLCHSHLCFHLVWLHGSSFIPFACVDCHHSVLVHLRTFFKVSITAVDLSSQTHHMARHILSAITSYRKGKLIRNHNFLALA